jgi:hypothetical protein
MTPLADPSDLGQPMPDEPLQGCGIVFTHDGEVKSFMRSPRRKWIDHGDGLVLDAPRNKPLRSQRIRRLQKAYARDLDIRWGIVALLVVVPVVVLAILAVLKAWNIAP